MALKDDVTSRLASFGYTVIEADGWMLDFIIDKIEGQLIKDCGVYDETTNTMIVPTGLYQVEVDMVCGDFLFTKKAFNQLTGIDASAVKSIQEGDTNITFAQTPEERLEALIAWLKKPEVDLVSYRKIQW